MSDTYNVRAKIEGKSINEVVSKIMLGSYYADYELMELEVALATEQTNVLFWEDVEANFDAKEAPAADNNPNETFQFPHVKTLVNGLKQKRHDERG